MTYRSLLVLLDQDPLCAARTGVAIRLARSLEAHLVGLAPTGLIDVPVMPEIGGNFAELTEMAWTEMRSRAQAAAARMRQACTDGGLGSFETVVDENDVAASLVRHAHCSDLAIVSQADPQARGHAATQAIVEQALLYSARPTLVLPYAGTFEPLGQRVLVAWDDSREATRAVTDALPLLRRARGVEVVWWNEGGMADDTPLVQRRLESLKQWLAWQGVAAEVAVETTTIPIGEAMLSRAADRGSDLVVMGAYGHARWAESMLGGATRSLLHTMTVPVLMSH